MDHEPHDHDDNAEQFEGFSVDEIRKNFKNLASELDENNNASLDELVVEAQQETVPPLRGYTPTINDYLARAATRDECREIIDYCEKQGEISPSEAEDLRDRLEKGGPRAFGTRRSGYYNQHL